MLQNWLIRLAGFHEGDPKVTVEDLIPTAAWALRVGVTLTPLDLVALSQIERDALELAPAAQQLHDDEETWADRAREAVRGQ